MGLNSEVCIIYWIGSKFLGSSLSLLVLILLREFWEDAVYFSDYCCFTLLRYGTVDELKEAVRAFHDVGIKVLGDAVLNHRCAQYQNQNGVWNIFGGRLNWDDRAVVADDPHFQVTNFSSPTTFLELAILMFFEVATLEFWVSFCIFLRMSSFFCISQTSESEVKFPFTCRQVLKMIAFVCEH